MHHAGKNNIDLILVEGLIAGDESAFKKVYYAYYDKLYFYCLKFLKSDELTKDVLQDIFSKLWSYKSKINPDQNFEAYIFTIARNEIFDYLRKVAKDKGLKNELLSNAKKKFISHNPTEEDLVFAEYSALAGQVINMLPAQRKLIFELSRYKGLSHEEIAATLGISKNTVKVQISRALKAIRTYLKTYMDFSLIIVLFLHHL